MIPPPPLYLPQKRDLLWVQLPTKDFPFNLTFYIKAKVLSAPLKQHLTQCHIFLLKKGKVFSFSLAEVSKSVRLIAKLSKMHQERVLSSGEVMYHMLYLLYCISDAKNLNFRTKTILRK